MRWEGQKYISMLLCSVGGNPLQVM